jgi:hypothetical protein
MSPDPRLDTHATRLVETEIGAALARPSGGSHSLPEDVLRDAARRLEMLCLISALVWTANLLLLNYVYAVPGTLAAGRVASYWKWRTLYDAVITLNVLGSFGLFWFTRHNTRRPQFILDLALVYEVLTALSVGILDYAEQGPTEGGLLDRGHHPALCADRAEHPGKNPRRCPGRRQYGAGGRPGLAGARLRAGGP